MRKIFLILGLIAIALFLAGCAKAGEETPEAAADDNAAIAGEATRRLLPPTVLKGELMLLNATCSCSGGEILEYMGADKVTKTQPMVKFKQWNTGEILERPLNSGGLASLRLCGETFTVRLSNPEVEDSPLTADFDGNGGIDPMDTRKLKYKYGSH